MPQCQRPNPRRRTGVLTPPSDPLEAMAFAVAALQRTLAQAAPKDAPAVARQLVAAAKEWEAALERQRVREQDAVRAAAEEKREREIGAMVRALDAAFPDWKPWGDCDVRFVAETLREEGLTQAVLAMPPEGHPPPGYWDGISSARAGRDGAPRDAAPEPPQDDFDRDGFDAGPAAQREQQKKQHAAHTPAREDPPPPPHPGPRVRVL